MSVVPASTPSNPSAAPTEPPGFKTLRRMVTVLTVTLILGILTIAATLVIRIMMETGPAPVTAVAATQIAVPAGEAITATGATASALTLATRDAAGQERLRVFHPVTGAQVGETLIARVPAR